MPKVVGRKILLFFLTLTGLLFSSNKVFAATIETPTNVPVEIQISQTFSFNTNITGIQAGEVYFVKCRLGQTSVSLTEGQSYNSTTNTWLSDTNSWIDFPTVSTSGNSVSVSIQCRVKSNASSGQKVIYARACLKKSDGSCGTSFQSSSGTPTNAISSSSTTSTPTPSSTPASSPTPISSTSQSSSSFIISGIPSQINSDQSFTTLVNLSLPNNPNTSFYLKGAFKKADSSNYFGFTKVSGNWVKNSSTYSDQYFITTDSSGNWSGNLEIKPDPEDSGYTGSDDYIFKVGRYSNSGSGPLWSNETTIRILTVSSNFSNQSDGQSNSIVNPKSSPALLDTNKTTVPFPSKSIVKIDSNIASVAGVNSSSSSATPSAEVQVKNAKRSINPIVWVGSLLIISGIISLIFIYLRSRKIV